MQKFKVVLEDQSEGFHAEVLVDAENEGAAHVAAHRKSTEALEALDWQRVDFELDTNSVKVFSVEPA